MPRKTLKALVARFGDAIHHLVVPTDASHALSWTEATVIARLARDGPATTGDLARAQGMKPDSIGTTIEALEKMGMVQHRSDPRDGGEPDIELTAKGAAARESTGARAVRPGGTVRVRSRHVSDTDGRA
jgi:DNA-binding MarR family transcriptional regulator